MIQQAAKITCDEFIKASLSCSVSLLWISVLQPPENVVRCPPWPLTYTSATKLYCHHWGKTPFGVPLNQENFMDLGWTRYPLNEVELITITMPSSCPWNKHFHPTQPTGSIETDDIIPIYFLQVRTPRSPMDVRLLWSSIWCKCRSSHDRDKHADML